MGLMEAIVEGSSIFRERRELAKAEAKAEGQSEEARRLLCLTLASRVPGLESMPELGRVTGLAAFETLLIDHTIRSQDRESLVRAILAASA